MLTIEETFFFEFKGIIGITGRFNLEGEVFVVVVTIFFLFCFCFNTSKRFFINGVIIGREGGETCTNLTIIGDLVGGDRNEITLLLLIVNFTGADGWLHQRPAPPPFPGFPWIGQPLPALL